MSLLLVRSTGFSLPQHRPDFGRLPDRMNPGLRTPAPGLMGMIQSRQELAASREPCTPPDPDRAPPAPPMTRNSTRPLPGATLRRMGTLASAPLPVVRKPPADLRPPLENGAHLSACEFLRRYEAMPELKKAELIGGVIYMASPVRLNQHGEPDSLVQTWLGTYGIATPGVKAATNATTRLGPDDVPQPDAAAQNVRSLSVVEFRKEPAAPCPSPRSLYRLWPAPTPPELCPPAEPSKAAIRTACPQFIAPVRIRTRFRSQNRAFPPLRLSVLASLR
jgi:hypothetical protein